MTIEIRTVSAADYASGVEYQIWALSVVVQSNGIEPNTGLRCSDDTGKGGKYEHLIYQGTSTCSIGSNCADGVRCPS